MSEMNPSNKCSHLFNGPGSDSRPTLSEIFKMQESLQINLAKRGRGVDYGFSSFKHNVDDISKQWRNLSLEFAELMERLPFKEWKTYTPEQLSGFISEEQKLEVWYEYVDMLHFFVNIGLALGIDGDTLSKLYATKNAENFDRQKRGY